ncbi:MAG TPA: hypothetical protein VJJ24_02030 [Candidatus Paceibacterota bacterium]
MKNIVTPVILDILQAGTYVTTDLFDTMLRSYPDSYKTVKRKFYNRQPLELTWSKLYKERQSFSATLSRLQKQGLIAKKTRQGKWSITDLGLRKFEGSSISIIDRFSCGDKENKTTIISYDIPESLSKQRWWLRGVLKILEFEMIHKSFWVGNKRLSYEFIKELRKRGLFKYVEILEINKRGTLDKITH